MQSSWPSFSPGTPRSVGLSEKFPRGPRVPTAHSRSFARVRSLRDNLIGERGAKAIAQALTANTALMFLECERCSATPVALAYTPRPNSPP